MKRGVAPRHFRVAIVAVRDSRCPRAAPATPTPPTNKAVNPINLYGATKLCSEKLFIQSNSYSGAKNTRFSCVRYGNVVGSRGSVVEVFRSQQQNGSVTVTDPRMTRFWISLDQGVSFVISCLSEMAGGEVFVPRLPACTVDVLTQAIAPGMPIDHIGIRPGEKMHETMITFDESHNVIEFDNYFVIKPSYAAWGGPERTDGTPVTERFSYSSDGTYALSVEETRELLRDLGFVG